MTIDEAIVHAREVASRMFDDRVHCIKCAEEHEQLAEWLEELQQYRAIDTPEECRAAAEKQKPMAVVEKTMFSPLGENIGRCPVCVGVALRQYDHPYCPDCGQKLDWEDEA